MFDVLVDAEVAVAVGLLVVVVGIVVVMGVVELLLGVVAAVLVVFVQGASAGHQIYFVELKICIIICNSGH